MFVRAGNLDSPIAGPACVTPSGLRGASCQVPFQEWCHFHRGLTAAPWQCVGTKRADQRTWPERNPQHAGPVRDQAFLAFSRRRGSTTTGQADTAQERIQNNPSRSCVSPRGTRKLRFPYMSISQIEGSAANKSSFLPTPKTQLIYSQQVSPGTQKICYRTGNEKISISSQRKGEESHPYTDRKSADQNPSHVREMTVPFFNAGSYESQVPLRLPSLLREELPSQDYLLIALY